MSVTAARLATSKLVWFALIGLGFGLATGCSLEQAKEHTITIHVGQSDSSGLQIGAAASSLATASLDPVPTTIDEFNCYALSVSGPEIPEHSILNGSCPLDSGRLRAGIFVGLIPSSGGVIEALVPSGPGRVFSLIGVKSQSGYCPTSEEILAMVQSDSTGSGLGDPYVLGQTTQDIESDTSIDLYATWDASDADNRKTCIGYREGSNDSFNGIVPTGVYAGQYTLPYVDPAPSPQPTPFSSPIPTASGTPPGAPELSSVTSLGSTEISKLSSFYSNYSGLAPAFNTTGGSYVYHEVSGSSAPAGERAVIQLQWDVTDVDLVATPYMHIKAQYAGGGITSSGSDCTTAYAGQPSPAWMATIGHVALFLPNGLGYPTWGWSRQSEGNTNNPQGLQWVDIYEGLTTNYTTTRSDGRQYVIVNIESGYASSSTACRSYVAIEGAGLEFLAAPATLEASPDLSATPQVFDLATYGNRAFSVEGGVKPYTATVLEGSAYGYATVDYSKSYVINYDGPPTMPGGSTTPVLATIQITDSSPTPQTITRQVAINPPPAPLALALVGYAFVSMPGSPGIAGTSVTPSSTISSAAVASPVLESVNVTDGATNAIDLFFEVPTSLPEPITRYRNIGLNISQFLSGTEYTCNSGATTLNPGSIGFGVVAYRVSSNSMEYLTDGTYTPVSTPASYAGTANLYSSHAGDFVMSGVTILGTTKDIITIRIGGMNNPTPVGTGCGRILVGDTSAGGLSAVLQ